MSICWFNNDDKKKFRCEYSVEQDCIKVQVEYDIEQEIETGPDGVRVIGVNTTFKNRDILVVDVDSKKSFLLKNARYNGMSQRYGSYDDRQICIFVSDIYFAARTEDLIHLLPTPKIKKIRLFSKMIADYLNRPSVGIHNTNDTCLITLTRNRDETGIDIGKNNIKRITLNDTWKMMDSGMSISIDISGYIEIELYKKTNYTEISSYIYESMIYMQLFSQGNFILEEVIVEVDDRLYKLYLPLRKSSYKKNRRDNSVSISLLEFLKLCYLKIPYRHSKDEIRNIPYIVMNSYENIEDMFLMLYRFIECYYKRHGVKRTFIKKCFAEHYHDKNSAGSEKIACYVRELICLRNHYVHSGYYIKNGYLRITFAKRGEDPRDYTAEVSVQWIYERVQIMRAMVLDIIFREMLGIEQYRYS